MASSGNEVVTENPSAETQETSENPSRVPNKANVERSPGGATGIHPRWKQVECGIASFYGEELRGNPTASGQPFNPEGMTAAHRTLPFGTRVRVVLGMGSPEGAEPMVTVSINDRGPFVAGRKIDLSQGAFRALTSPSRGTANVCLYVTVPQNASLTAGN